MKIIHELTLDVSRQGVQASVPITQHDTGTHVLLIHLRNGSKEIKLNSSLTATLYLSNDSYESVTVYTENGAHPNTLECNVTPYMSSKVGEVTAQLQIFEGADRVFSAPEFMLVIKKDRASGSNVAQSTPFAAVVAAQQAAEYAAEQAEEAKGDAYLFAAASETAAQEAAQSAESASKVAAETAATVAEEIAERIATDKTAGAGEIVQAYVNKNCTNALRGKASGVVLSMDDVSPFPHKIPVKMSSKNICDNIYEIGGINQDTGNNYISGSSSRSVNYYAIEPNANYTISKYGIDVAVRFRFYDANKTYIGWFYSAVSVGVNERTFIAPSNAYYLRFDVVSTTIDGVLFQLEKSLVATAYAPYVAEDVQVTVKSYGKNLIPYPYSSQFENNTTYIKNGITFTKNDNGSITLNGTATADADAFIYSSVSKPYPLMAGYYCFSGSISNDIFIKIDKRDANGTVKWNWGNYTNKIGEANEGDMLHAISIYVKSGTVCDNVVVYPQMERGTVVSSYEQYRGETVTTTIAEGAELDSVPPNMTIYTDTAGAVMECRYNRDINIVLNKVHPELGIPLDPDAPEKPKEMATFDLLASWSGSALDYLDTYTYEKGMTWREFVESEYNVLSDTADYYGWTVKFKIDGDIIIAYGEDHAMQIFGTEVGESGYPDYEYQFDVSPDDKITYSGYFWWE